MCPMCYIYVTFVCSPFTKHTTYICYVRFNSCVVYCKPRVFDRVILWIMMFLLTYSDGYS